MVLLVTVQLWRMKVCESFCQGIRDGLAAATKTSTGCVWACSNKVAMMFHCSLLQTLIMIDCYRDSYWSVHTEAEHPKWWSRDANGLLFSAFADGRGPVSVSVWGHDLLRLCRRHGASLQPRRPAVRLHAAQATPPGLWRGGRHRGQVSTGRAQE